MKHFDELLIYMQDKPFDILTLNETRLDNSISDSEVKIPGYDIVRCDRNRNGGGIAMFIRSNDHHLVYICRKVSLPKELPKIIFNKQFKNFNVNQFKEELRNNINTNIVTNDPNILSNDWKTKFLTIAEKHAPMQQCRVKSDYKPWLTDQIKK